MRLCSRVVLVLVLALAGCRQDPLRMRSFGDGAPGLDLAASDGPRVERRPVEARLPDRPPKSWDACRATLEVCNGFDDNCDSQIDEGFDKQSDPRFCEGCKGCAWLTVDPKLHVSMPGCAKSKCVIASCRNGFQDLDGDIKTGCEYECTPTGVEICDGKDNDCNGKIDDGVSLGQNICKTLGACQGAKPVCKGATGWQCDYGPDVELQPCTKDADCGSGVCDVGKGVCPGIVAFDEKRCDGKDGDCDGLVDDPWAHPQLPHALGTECDFDDPPKKGICRNFGKYVCDASGKGVVCQQITAPQTPRPEECNGLDDDCDGLVDEATDDAGGKRVMDSMVHVQRTVGGKAYNFYIYTVEASRPDATATAQGSGSTRACTRPGTLPWTSVSYAGAAAACAAAGKRLCTGAEWQVACEGATPHAYPYGDAFQASACNGYEHGQGSAAPTGSMAQCIGGDPGLLDMSGNVREWTSEQRGTTPAPENAPIYVVRGGAYNTPWAGLTCAFDLSQAVGTVVLPATGFRCCSDTAP